MTKDDIRRGIDAYDKQQATLIDVIKAHGGRLTDKEFDVEFRGWPERKHPFHWGGLSGHTFILGGFQGPWAQWLDLLQHMAAIDLVKITSEGELIVYSLPG